MSARVSGPRATALATAVVLLGALLAPGAALAAAPSAVDDGYTVDEDQTLTSVVPGVLGNDSDADSDPMAAELVDDVAHGTLALNADGSFAYTPAQDWNGDDGFTYQVQAGGETSGIATVSIHVNAVDDAPVAADDGYSVNEDASLSVTAANGILKNDTDVDGPAPSAVLVAGVGHGSLALNANGSFSYAPTANFSGTDTFTYRASDGTKQSNIATVTLTVNPVNDAPVAVGESYSTAEDTPLVAAAAGVLANDTDADGQSLTASAVSQPTHGSLNLAANGGFTYAPAANYNGADNFTYHASDGTAFSNTVTVSLTVTAVNDPPLAAPDSGSTVEDVPLVVAAPGVLGNDSDPEGQSLTANLITGTSHGSLSLSSSGAYTYTPAAGYSGSDSFTYQVSDGSMTASALVSLTITAVDDPPVAVADSGTTAEDTQLIVAAPGVLGNDSDIDSGSITASPLVGPSHGSVSLNADGSYTYTPSANYTGPDSFTYRAYDGTSYSASATVSLTITAVNDAPVAVADSRTTNEDTVLNGATVLGNDSDVDAGTALTAVLDAGPARGALQLNANGTFVYTPQANDNGSVTFTYHASDGSLSSNVVTVTITIAAINDAPIAVADTGTTAEDAALVVASPGLRANDTDVDTALASLTASVVTQPAHGTVIVNANGSYAYTPTTDYNGSDSFTYRVYDGALYSAPATVSLTVTAVNDAPVGVADAYLATEDVALVVAATSGVLADDTDVDSAGLTSALIVGPSHGTLSLATTGAFTYTPAANYNGVDAFTYRASDGLLQSAIAQVNLTVGSVNDPPTFVLGPDQTVAEDSGTTTVPGFLASISPGPADESGQSTSISVVAAYPALFSVTGPPTISSNGTLTFRPAANTDGSTPVTVTVTDDGGTTSGGADSSSDTFVITVTGQNDPVYANSDSWRLSDNPPAWIEAGITTPLDVLANDVSIDVGEQLTITGATKPGHGTVAIASDKGSLSYRSTTGYSGTDSFTYTMTDGLYSDSATVRLSVADTRPPTLATPTFRFGTGATMTSTVRVKLGWGASDPGSGVKSYDVQQSTNGGSSFATIYSATTATSATRSLAFNTHYSYRFRARDKGNRTSAWSAWTTFTPTRYQESTSLATYSSGWKTASISSASGDHTRYSTTRGALSTFSFTGRAVSLVAPRSASRGKAAIRVDGVLVATVSLYHSTTQARRHVWSKSWGAVGAHVVAVTVLRTSGHPRFDIDAWTVLK